LRSDGEKSSLERKAELGREGNLEETQNLEEKENLYQRPIFTGPSRITVRAPP
jgi:hypothetical protein